MGFRRHLEAVPPPVEEDHVQTSAGDLEDDELEGWKELERHTRIAIRTLQRREERAFDPFPVIRRNARIFARRADVDAWLERERRRRDDTPGDTHDTVAHRGASSRSTHARAAATVSNNSPEARMQQAAAAKAERADRRQTSIVLSDEDLEALDELVPMLARRVGAEGAIRPPTRSTALRAALRRGLRQLRDELGEANTEPAAGDGTGGQT